jgi:hypothetical protein
MQAVRSSAHMSVPSSRVTHNSFLSTPEFTNFNSYFLPGINANTASITLPQLLRWLTIHQLVNFHLAHFHEWPARTRECLVKANEQVNRRTHAPRKWSGDFFTGRVAEWMQ